MWRLLALGALVAAVVIAGFSLIDGGGDQVTATAMIPMPDADLTGFAQALEPWDWQFPRSHGAHNDFQTEWWYYTGNLRGEDGQRFGFQFTIFRRAISPNENGSDSEWRTRQVYMAHFTVSDLDGGRFLHEERYSRGAGNLAGALPDDFQPDADYRVWLEDWQVFAENDDATIFRIDAHTGAFGVNLRLDQLKPPALQGYDGLSPKSGELGNASYYYTLSRLRTEGTLTIEGQDFAVSGYTWMDHEFSTSALGGDAEGWDWFGLIFDDGREMMIGQIRLTDGGREPAFGGLLIDVDGSTRYLPSHTFDIQATVTWESPHTGAVYPAGWQVTIDAAALGQDADMMFSITPLMADQELHSGDIAYWEGAVRVDGDVTGYGYAELTGYVDVMTGRF